MHGGCWTTHIADRSLMLWNLSHNAVFVDLNGSNVDLAVGRTYNYLNNGPGARAFLYVAKRWQDDLTSPLCRWMGPAAPFAFEDAYRPTPGTIAASSTPLYPSHEDVGNAREVLQMLKT